MTNVDVTKGPLVQLWTRTLFSVEIIFINRMKLNCPPLTVSAQVIEGRLSEL